MSGDPRFDSERAWAKDQLEEYAALSASEESLVLRMLEVWWNDQLDVHGDPWQALSVFETLARGKALEKPEQVSEDFTWVQAAPGQISKADYVRVRLDAYDGPAGLAHNGRTGRIAAIRGGDVHVMYDDSKGNLGNMPTRHSPYTLERRVPR